MVYHMYDNEEYHPKAIRVLYSKAKFTNGTWLKCSGDFMCPKPYQYFKHLLTFPVSRGGKTTHWYGCKIDNKIGLTEPGVTHFDFYYAARNKWGYVYFFVKLPDDLPDGDELMLDVWNVDSEDIYIDNVSPDLYKNK